MSQAGFSRSGGATRRCPAALRAAHGLALVASPVFAMMAWISGSDAPHAHGPSGPNVLPFDGMTTMYLLMSLFHLPPWLKLASIAGRASNR